MSGTFIILSRLPIYPFFCLRVIKSQLSTDVIIHILVTCIVPSILCVVRLTWQAQPTSRGGEWGFKGKGSQGLFTSKTQIRPQTLMFETHDKNSNKSCYSLSYEHSGGKLPPPKDDLSNSKVISSHIQQTWGYSHLFGGCFSCNWQKPWRFFIAPLTLQNYLVLQ